jgi:AraC-like DNA-binding protein
MTEALKELTDLPGAGVRPQALAELLSMIRLSGAIFLRGEFTAPWSYESPPPEVLINVLSPGAKRLILFHIVAEGECWVRLSNGDEANLKAGDVVVLPYGDRHLVGGPEPSAPIAVESLMQAPPWADFPVIRWGGGGSPTTIVCGYLRCDDAIFDPVVRALPPLFSVTPPEGPAASWVTSSIEYALEATDGSAAAEGGVGVRLPELVLSEVLRLYVKSRPDELSGWLAAVHDRYVGRALAALHAEPARRWSLDQLARHCACSRSTLDGRFRRLLGRSPMRYLGEWRLRLAASLLRDSSLGIAGVAYRVGYDSEAAFNRAFKRAMGSPPARWRDQSS